MRSGRESQTAVMVAMWRAVAHGTTAEPRFSDPTAMTLLPEEARPRVERFRAGTPPRGLRERLGRRYFHYGVQAMVARTVAIDDAVREAGAAQLVILGAGLDGRAWRMPELVDTTVWEVDHPDSQRTKRQRSEPLTRAARDVRFVPVDFTRDSLGDALAAAGHDPVAPTTWVWEGVVMYLTPAQLNSTLAVVAERSAPGSHLVILYHRPAPTLWLIGLMVRRVGEPLRSSYTDWQMAALLDAHGFDVGSMARLDAAFQAAPYVLAAGLFWVIALIVGQALLGLALWRSRVVSVIFPIALLLGGPTHPFVPGNHVAVGIGLLVAAVGYAGASIALSRTSDDDFDLPPLPRRRS